MDAVNDVYKQLRDIALEHDIVLVTAKQRYPAGGWPNWIPQPQFIIVDYINILRPTRAS